MTDYKPDNCKKCGASGFYYPETNEEKENGFPKIDQWGRTEAFDPKYRVPHWYVCAANARGKVNVQNLIENRKITTPTAISPEQKKEDDIIRVNYFKDVSFPPDVVAQIIVKIQVMEMTLEEIKKLMNRNTT